MWRRPVTVAFAVTVLGLLLTLLGSTALGITLLAKRFRPPSAALLLALSIPLALGILQTTSVGSAALSVMLAFGILGRRIARTAELTRTAATGEIARTA